MRGRRAAREIKYSDWRKFCFKTPGTNMVCRTSITGTFETGQSAVRIDLTEREGDKAARLQLFLPVGLYLQAGVKITIDQGAAADAKRDPDVPADQGGKRAHEASPTRKVRAAIPKGMWVAAMIRPPRAR